MQENIWFRPLVWMDYRLAVLFTVIIPLILLVWAIVQKSDAVQRLMIIYWRVASLLAITIYLTIGSWSIAFISALAVRILIPISLWFWQDINEEISDLPERKLKLGVTSWRWAITVYSLLGAIGQIPFLRCAFSAGAMNEPFCQVWREPPLLFKEYFHANTKPGFLGFIGLMALIIYVAYFVYFLFFRLGKQGRSAIEQ
ncbi:DUF3177 family protein [Aerosakkonemataceae cyanobacterium BLCC-F154]|uniref:DUF3177 family protein n=1 Tax=Floridaenema fluviatile BLCC-F154 TaxID=3153640 RepID=A0ABV4Y647_9CYAN